MLNNLGSSVFLHLLIFLMFLETNFILFVFEQKSLSFLNVTIIKITFLKKLFALKRIELTHLWITFILYLFIFTLTFFTCFNNTEFVEVLFILPIIVMLKDLKETDYPLLIVVTLISLMSFVFQLIPYILIGIYILLLVDYIIHNNLKLNFINFLAQILFLLTILHSAKADHFINIYYLLLLSPLLIFLYKSFIEFFPLRRNHSRLYIRLMLIVFGLAFELGDK